MSEPTVSVFVTKYALTKGIQTVAVCVLKYHPNTAYMPTRSQFFFGEGKEWHRTRESAIAEANRMRDAKIISLQEAIAKLDSTVFK